MVVLSKLRPGRNNKWRVAPISTFEEGQLLVSEQVEVKRPSSDWQPTSETWQTILGHGGRVESGSQAGIYLIPYDCDPGDLSGTATFGEELTRLLGYIEAQRLLVFLDSATAFYLGCKQVDTGPRDPTQTGSQRPIR